MKPPVELNQTTNAPAPPSAAPTAPVVAASVPLRARPRLQWFALFACLLTLAFAKPLLGLVGYALRADLHSHALLLPFVSLYLVWLRRRDPLPPCSGSPALAIVPLVIGLVALKAVWFPAPTMTAVPVNDQLAPAILSYVCLFWAGAVWLLGAPRFRALAFPFLLLIFLVPMSTPLADAIEIFFQRASAEATALLFGITGATVFRDGLVFQLPGITIQVAQECSGIRSSLVLFITSLLAGHLFLHSPWRRTVLTLFVIPLAILRNGFRIFTIAMLCVHVDPGMINSVIHKKGGPLFFALSLIPFFLLLLWLRGRERRGRGLHGATTKAASSDS